MKTHFLLLYMYFKSVSLTQYCLFDNIEKNDMVEACSTYGGG